MRLARAGGECCAAVRHAESNRRLGVLHVDLGIYRGSANTCGAQWRADVIGGASAQSTHIGNDGPVVDLHLGARRFARLLLQRAPFNLGTVERFTAEFLDRKTRARPDVDGGSVFEKQNDIAVGLGFDSRAGGDFRVLFEPRSRARIKPCVALHFHRPNGSGRKSEARRGRQRDQRGEQAGKNRGSAGRHQMNNAP